PAREPVLPLNSLNHPGLAAQCCTAPAAYQELILKMSKSKGNITARSSPEGTGGDFGDSDRRLLQRCAAKCRMAGTSSIPECDAFRIAKSRISIWNLHANALIPGHPPDALKAARPILRKAIMSITAAEIRPQGRPSDWRTPLVII